MDTRGKTEYKTDQQKVKEITDKLEQGLSELFESEKYKNYLNTMSKFHNYSINNTLLIAMQKPDATLVAGYQAWQKNFERHVNKGEKGIRILAPAPYKIKEERDKLDPITGEMLLDKDGLPQKEEVEVTIPVFRAVSVFDVSQTDGKPIPELETKELLASVEGYEDFMQALSQVSPVPIAFEDIPGDARGYFSIEDKKIVIQEGMSQSQTMKTGIHEIAHSKLHDRDLNNSLDTVMKDRNTKEVEAESIAYTVCQHFGIDTSEYSFSYVAGWSSGKEAPELKSSLDTIRKTASELITGIEASLREIQLSREEERAEAKESIVLLHNDDYTSYNLFSVQGMETDMIVDTLMQMNDDDKLNVSAYLESKGAWVTEIADQDSREANEYHLDVRYNTDKDIVIDVKAEIAIDEKAKEPINANDIILKITHKDGYEVERFLDTSEDEVVEKVMKALAKLEDKREKSVHDCLKSAGMEYVPIIVSGGRNEGIPQFNDIEFDLVKKDVKFAHHLAASKQAENLINRLEYGKPAFSEEERDLIVNYAFKFNDMEKTRELAEHIYYEEAYGNGGAALAIISAQAEIDNLPDPMVGISEMNDYGYDWSEMLPLTPERALELYDQDVAVYLLHEDGSETLAEGRELLEGYDGLCGVEKADWERYMDRAQDIEQEIGANKEAQLLYSTSDKYGIYQLKKNPELDQFRFTGTEALKRLGITKDNFESIKPENYDLIYVGDLSELKEQTQSETLEAIYEKFNIDHPKDYKGHSLSVSDIVVLHEDGENSAHFVDSFGFTGVPDFVKGLEGVKEQEVEQPEKEDKRDIPIYRETASYARDQGELDLFRLSHKTNMECKAAIEAAVRENFDGMHLNANAVKPVLEEYGAERVGYVLTNTIQQKEWDGRFSKSNKEWAAETVATENTVIGEDRNLSLVVESHPAVLDGFVDLFRQELMERNIELVAGHEVMEEQETELAFQIGDRYLMIHETDGGYDYSVMGLDYREIDGGVYDNPDIGIREALADIVEDLKAPRFDEQTGTYYHSLEQGNIMVNDELIPMDYEEMEEKVDEANRIEPSTVVEDFREKTREHFHEISEMSPEEIEETVKCHVQAKIDEYGIDATIIDAVVIGSRSRGIENENSDIDVVVELSTNEREDDLFNAFNEDGLLIGGISVDINPITEQRTGTLETYLPMAEAYLEEKMQQMAEQAKEVEVTFTVAECSEFHDQGAFYDGITSAEEALRIYENIPADRMNGVPAVGIQVHVVGEEPDQDTQMDIYSGKNINLDLLVHIPEIAGEEKALDMIAELAGCVPDKEIIGEIPKELHDKIELQREDEDYKPLAKVEEIEEQNYNMIDNRLNNGAGEKNRENKEKVEQVERSERPSLSAKLVENKAKVNSQSIQTQSAVNDKKNHREEL